MVSAWPLKAFLPSTGVPWKRAPWLAAMLPFNAADIENCGMHRMQFGVGM